MQYWSTATRNRVKLYQRIVAFEFMFVEKAYTYVGIVCLRFGLHYLHKVLSVLDWVHRTLLCCYLKAADILLDRGADIESKSKDVHRCSLLLTILLFVSALCECIILFNYAWCCCTVLASIDRICTKPWQLFI